MSEISLLTPSPTEIPPILIDGQAVESIEKVPEIEDKYLIPRPSQAFLQQAEISEIHQAYLPNGWRIREEIKADKSKVYTAVYKKRVGDRMRIEHTVRIKDEAQFNKLWGQAEAFITKTRYKINVGDYEIDIDEFHEELEGHWLAEVEAKTKVEQDAYDELDAFEVDPPIVFRNEFGILPSLKGDERKRYKSRTLAYEGWPKRK